MDLVNKLSSHFTRLSQTTRPHVFGPCHFVASLSFHATIIWRSSTLKQHQRGRTRIENLILLQRMILQLLLYYFDKPVKHDATLIWTKIVQSLVTAVSFVIKWTLHGLFGAVSRVQKCKFLFLSLMFWIKTLVLSHMLRRYIQVLHGKS